MTEHSERLGVHPVTVAADYLRYTRQLRTQEPDAAAEAAYDLVERTIHHGPASLGWEYVLAILTQGSDDDLDYLAAGPLENLVRAHGTALVESIEREAERDPRFKWALGCIWLTEDILPEDVRDRIVRASDEHIKVLGRETPVGE